MKDLIVFSFNILLFIFCILGIVEFYFIPIFLNILYSCIFFCCCFDPLLSMTMILKISQGLRFD